MVEIEGVEQLPPPTYTMGTYGGTSLVTKTEDVEDAPTFIVLKSGDPETVISVDMFESLTDEQRASLMIQYNLEM